MPKRIKSKRIQPCNETGHEMIVAGFNGGPRGSYVVGEGGPERFVPDTAGYVYPTYQAAPGSYGQNGSSGGRRR